MELHYVAGRSGRLASASPPLPSLKEAIDENGSEAEDQNPGGSNNDSTETGSRAPATGQPLRGHKPRPSVLSTVSGSTLVSPHLGTENIGANGGPMDRGLNPNVPVFHPNEDSHEHNGQQQHLQPQPQSPQKGRKHDCRTKEAIAENRRIYIGNLEFQVTHDDIAIFLEELGHYKSKNPKTKPEHQNRGYCFVTYQDSDSATAAMNKINYKEFAGRKLVSRCCLPKGLTYVEHLDRQGLIRQGGPQIFPDGSSPDRHLASMNGYAANGYNGGGGVFGNDAIDIYRPPSDSTQADDRTIEVLNLPAVPGTYDNFKTYIQGQLNDIEITGVSEPIYQYSPQRPSFPFIQGSGPSVVSFHGCPWFYCYIQLGSKEDAENAFKKLDGMEFGYGGNIWKCRVNKSWKIHGSD
ncbi:hypothetical protein PG988_008760 [Apiospora saccharicola]